MENITLTCTMNQHDHFRAQLDILYRAAIHAIVLFSVVFAAFWAVFFADYGTNGTWISWSITGSLLYFTVVVGAMVAVYLGYSPIHAKIKAALIARDVTKLEPYTVQIGKDKITVKTADGAVTHFGWYDLKIYRETKRFLILRDRKKKNQTGQLILPKKDVPPEQILEILQYREDVIRAEDIKKNPVARERARQEKLVREKSGMKPIGSAVVEALEESARTMNPKNVPEPSPTVSADVGEEESIPEKTTAATQQKSDAETERQARKPVPEPAESDRAGRRAEDKTEADT